MLTFLRVKLPEYSSYSISWEHDYTFNSACNAIIMEYCQTLQSTTAQMTIFFIFYEVKIWIILSSGCITILSLSVLCCVYSNAAN